MYRCLSRQAFSQGSYQILSLRKEDIFLIKDWRNEQIDVLRQKSPLTDDDQLDYYNNVIHNTFEQRQPTMILFSYLEGGKCIGYGGLTNIVWEHQRAEISFLIETSRVGNDELYERDFFNFLQLMKQVALADLGLNRLFTETFDIRPFHISILEKSGFRLEGRLKQHVKIAGQFVDSLMHGYLKEWFVDVAR